MSVHHISYSLRIVGRDLEEGEKNLRDPTLKMGVNWGLHTPWKAKALVRVGPVGLEPTTYGLHIWLFAG
jgi:hypothetical protein